MTARFADSYFFFSLLSTTDKHHARAVQILRDLDSGLVTTAWILTEVADGFCSIRSRGAVQRLFRILREHALVSVRPTSQELFEQGLELYFARPDKEWSLTDCISFCVMQDGGITEALTGDHHFEQAGFTALLK